MIQCISFNLNKLKDDHPILITHAHAMCPSAKCATKMPYYTTRHVYMSITPLYPFKVLVRVLPYKHLQGFVCFQCGTSA